MQKKPYSLFKALPAYFSVLACLMACQPAETPCALADSSCDPLFGELYYFGDDGSSSQAVCERTYFEHIQPQNSAALFSELSTQAALGLAGTETTSLISGVGSGYYGGVLAADGKIYALPTATGGTPAVMIIDPATDTVDTTSIVLPAPGGGEFHGWSGGVLAPNGKIYGIPRAATNLLIIDPETGATDLSSITGLGTNTMKSFGGILAPNGKIYFTPYNPDTNGEVLIVDPATDTASTFVLTPPSGTANLYQGAALAPDGRIFAPPFNTPSMLVFSPDSNGEAYIPGGGGGFGDWVGLSNATDGNLYAFPSTENSILPIQVSSDSTGSTITTAFGTATAGVLGPNGRIYIFSGTETVIFDPLTGTYDDSTLTHAGGWSSGVLAPNGKIYGIPDSSSDVLVIDTRSNGALCDSIVMSSFLNKL